MTATSSIGRRPRIAQQSGHQRPLPTASVVKQLVDDRLDALRGRSTADLIQLPTSSTERFVGDDHRHLAVVIYHHNLGEGKHFVIVHGFREWLHGVFATSVVTSGIEFSATGEQHTLTPGELSDCLQLLGL